VAATLAVSVAAGGQATAAGGDAAAAQRLEQRAGALLGRAYARVYARTTSCSPDLKRRKPAIVDGSAGPRVASLIGVFRRPAAEADLAAATGVLGGDGSGDLLAQLFFAQIPRDGVRVAHSANGTKVTLVAATKVRRTGPAPAVQARCGAAIRRAIIRLARTVTPGVRRTALRTFDTIARREANEAAHPAVEGLQIIVGTGAGASYGTGGGFKPAQFIAHPPLTIAARRGRPVQLTMVFPDAVARVGLTFPRARASRRSAQRTVTVIDNVVSLHIARRNAGDALPATIAEIARDGRVIRTLHPYRGFAVLIIGQARAILRRAVTRTAPVTTVRPERSDPFA
jgi:hypothetical protein